MATTFMWWSKAAAAVLSLGLLSACAAPPVAGVQACPSRTGTTLRFVDVFDGSPEELASLVPDRAGQSSGYWNLGYVYEAGRFVTVRCRYDDKNTVDVKLADKIKRCDYTIDERHVLALQCE
jgi:hypothetical protein